MLIGALSFVMQVCCGISLTRSRMSTSVPFWMIGMRNRSPASRVVW